MKYPIYEDAFENPDFYPEDDDLSQAFKKVKIPASEKDSVEQRIKYFSSCYPDLYDAFFKRRIDIDWASLKRFSDLPDTAKKIKEITEMNISEETMRDMLKEFYSNMRTSIVKTFGIFPEIAKVWLANSSKPNILVVEFGTIQNTFDETQKTVDKTFITCPHCKTTEELGPNQLIPPHYIDDFHEAYMICEHCNNKYQILLKWIPMYLWPLDDDC